MTAKRVSFTLKQAEELAKAMFEAELGYEAFYTDSLGEEVDDDAYGNKPNKDFAHMKKMRRLLLDKIEEAK